MAKNRLRQRREMYFKLSSRIAHVDNAQLQLLLDNNAAHSGWGRNQTLALGQSKVFVKRVPVTNLEYENMFSTRNLYDLPTFYNYGVGSAGFGVFRELVSHIKTTNWVLDGVIDTFPLMYHYRIIPFTGTRAQVDRNQHKRYVEYWANHPNIGRYLLDRANANYEAVLFLEHIPYTVATWLLDHPQKIHQVMTEMRDTISFLRKQGILHLDPHFFNILADGQHSYLTDFGLALDRNFALTPAEQSFYRQNSHYDYGELLWSLGSHLYMMYQGLSDSDKSRIAKRFGISAKAEFEERMSILLNHIDEIYAEGMMKLDRRYAASLAKYRDIIMLMNNFYSEMRRNNKKDTRLEHTKLRRLLHETGFVVSTVSSRR